MGLCVLKQFCYHISTKLQTQVSNAWVVVAMTLSLEYDNVGKAVGVL